MADASAPRPSASIRSLSQEEALVQCIKASRRLLSEFTRIQKGDPDQETADLEKVARIREQLIQQTFVRPWSEEAVAQQLEQLQTLEALDQELRQLAQSVRDELHQKRSKNQHNRKAVNAYGFAKGQFQR